MINLNLITDEEKVELSNTIGKYVLDILNNIETITHDYRYALDNPLVAPYVVKLTAALNEEIAKIVANRKAS